MSADSVFVGGIGSIAIPDPDSLPEPGTETASRPRRHTSRGSDADDVRAMLYGGDDDEDAEDAREEADGVRAAIFGAADGRRAVGQSDEAARDLAWLRERERADRAEYVASTRRMLRGSRAEQATNRERAHDVADSVREMLANAPAPRTTRTPTRGGTGRPGTTRAEKADPLTVSDTLAQIGMSGQQSDTNTNETPTQRADRAVARRMPSGVRGLPPSLARRWGVG